MARRTAMAAIAAGLVAAGAQAGEKEDILAEMLPAQGLDRFAQVEELRFSFVVQRTDSRTERHWEWRPQEDRVTLTQGESRVSWVRGEMADAPEAVATADRRFVNDSFWLLWALHASWAPDAGLERVDEDTVRLSYPAEGGGYTPGDVYVIDHDDRGLTTQWAFHRGGSEEPSLVCTWEDYRQVGPLTIAANHRNEGGFHLSFEGMAVKMAGDPEWKFATPKSAD